MFILLLFVFPPTAGIYGFSAQIGLGQLSGGSGFGIRACWGERASGVLPEANLLWVGGVSLGSNASRFCFKKATE